MEILCLKRSALKPHEIHFLPSVQNKEMYFRRSRWLKDGRTTSISQVTHFILKKTNSRLFHSGIWPVSSRDLTASEKERAV